jgi:hypothetical protein
MVNNYYKYGPSTNVFMKNRIVTPYKLPNIPFGRFYVMGNYVDGFPNITTDNSLGVFFNQGTADDKKNYLVSSEFSAEPVTTQTAEEAYQTVLKQAGASHKRDTLDQRIINDIKNRTGRMIDVQGGYPHGTEYEKTMNAWPVLKSLPPMKDSDADGMPDEWEKKNGLNPNDPSDASAIKLHNFYTNIEVYINSLVK